MSHGKRVVAIKRVYEPPSPDDGERILVDRLWPRGLSKERAAVSIWLKDVAPSQALRKWFEHDVEKYVEFRQRYRAELAVEPGATALALLREHAERSRVTLIFAAHDSDHSNASVLRDLLAEA